MVSIEAFCPPDVFNPPAYTQGIRVTGAQTILFLSGQVAYDQQGGVLHRGDFRGQARERLSGRLNRWSKAPAERWAASSSSTPM